MKDRDDNKAYLYVTPVEDAYNIALNENDQERIKTILRHFTKYCVLYPFKRK